MPKNNQKKSALGINWQQKPYDERLALAISQKNNIPINLANLLAVKNIELTEVENFLNPTIKTTLPNPFDLKDMDIAAKNIVDNIIQKKQIVIFGDYDVDGATSSSLLKRFFTMAGINAGIYIPDRITEGYGPNSKALLNLKNQGANLVITVDCGTCSFEPLATAANAGLQIIVIDHHLGALENPQALAVVNPNRLDETFEHKNLAAVGVCFLLVVAVNKLLKEQNYYQKHGLNEPNLMSLLDLVALGTVCDVVPLTGVNRALVKQGLKVMKSRNNIGIRNLCDVAALDEAPTAYHLGFVIGPRINAGGRVGKANLGADLLSLENEDQAFNIAGQLDIYNKQRKDIEKQVLEEAINQIEKSNHQNTSILFAGCENWHQGVIGIVASRIKELYDKPTAIISLNSGIGKASCRSISGVDFGSAIVKAKLNKLLIDGGGHAMAGGFTIEENKITPLQQFFCQELGELVNLYNQQKTRYFADILDINSANLNLAKQIQMLEPYGAGNAKPKFLIKDLLIASADIIGSDKNHVRCILSAKTLAGWQGKIAAIAFKAMVNKLGAILISKNKLRKVSIIGQININKWMGNENLQVIIEDIII